MNALRWFLISVAAFAGGSFLLLAMIGGGFRRSFGASDTNPLIVVLPLMGIALLLAGLLFPHVRGLLHAGAVAAVILIGLSVWQIIADDAAVLWFAIAYAGAWLLFYWNAAWKNSVA